MLAPYQSCSAEGRLFWLLSVHLSVQFTRLPKELWTDFDEIFGAVGWPKEQSFHRFWCQHRSRSGSWNFTGFFNNCQDFQWQQGPHLRGLNSPGAFQSWLRSKEFNKLPVEVHFVNWLLCVISSGFNFMAGSVQMFSGTFQHQKSKIPRFSGPKYCDFRQWPIFVSVVCLTNTDRIIGRQNWSKWPILSVLCYAIAYGVLSTLIGQR